MNQKFIFKVCPESSDLIYTKDTISELNATYGEGKIAKEIYAILAQNSSAIPIVGFRAWIACRRFILTTRLGDNCARSTSWIATNSYGHTLSTIIKILHCR